MQNGFLSRSVARAPAALRWAAGSGGEVGCRFCSICPNRERISGWSLCLHQPDPQYSGTETPADTGEWERLASPLAIHSSGLPLTVALNFPRAVLEKLIRSGSVFQASGTAQEQHSKLRVNGLLKAMLPKSRGGSQIGTPAQVTWFQS